MDHRMNIEKMSRYITVRPGVSSPHGHERRVLLSLPRVKWLEAQPDYEPWPPLEAPRPKPEIKPEQINPRRHTFRPQLRSDELSTAQKQAWDLHRSGKSHAEVGAMLNKSTNAVGKLLAQAREKLGVNL